MQVCACVHITHFRGNILRATSMPGQYDRKAANAVSSNRPKMRMRFLQEGDRRLVRTPLWSECVIAGQKVLGLSRRALNTHFMPCCRMEFLLVLQMMRSAHWTMTILAKKAVWQVYSTIFLLWYVWIVKSKSPYRHCAKLFSIQLGLRNIKYVQNSTNGSHNSSNIGLKGQMMLCIKLYAVGYDGRQIKITMRCVNVPRGNLKPVETETYINRYKRRRL